MSKKKSKKGKDSKFFSSNTKKGEIREILDELCNPKLDVQRDAIKRVIALMTVGKDVSMLFPQVVNCMQTSKYLLYPQSKSTMMVLTPCSVGFNAQVSNKPTNKSSLKDLPLYLMSLSFFLFGILLCSIVLFLSSPSFVHTTRQSQRQSKSIQCYSYQNIPHMSKLKIQINNHSPPQKNTLVLQQLQKKQPTLN